MSDSVDASPLIGAGEPPAFSVVRSGTARPNGREIVFVCDHASNRIPAALGRLGLDERHLLDHIAWDIGAAAVAVKLIEWLGGRGVLGGYSRLVVVGR
ncbi:MAG: N-formylglutamate amidohydrolase [Gammaproteobacteria bacterium]